MQGGKNGTQSETILETQGDINENADGSIEQGESAIGHQIIAHLRPDELDAMHFRRIGSIFI